VARTACHIVCVAPAVPAELPRNRGDWQVVETVSLAPIRSGPIVTLQATFGNSTLGDCPGLCRMLRRAGSDRLAQGDRRDLKGFAVFCDGATRDHDALFPEGLGKLTVRKRLGGVLRADELFDQGANRG